jgi:tetratricopeptide (TPR) repeat protein
MTGKMTIALLKREAELYRSQGLHREAIGVYQKILEIGSPLDPEVRQAVQGRMQVLSQELAAIETGPCDAISATEVELIRSAWDTGGDPCNLHNCARAFREMGLFEEALAAYAKLYQPLCPAPDVLAGLCECLTRCCPAAKRPERFVHLLLPHGLDSRQTADAQFHLAEVAEKTGFGETALALYRAVHQIDPGYPGLRRRLNGLSGRGQLRFARAARRFGSSFARVLENGALGGLARRLGLLPAALASRLRAKGYPAARN